MKRLMGSRARGFTLLDLLVVLFLGLVLLTFLWPTTTRCGEGSSRVKCASNLRQIGQALLLYANENKENYPRTTHVEAKADTPEWGSGVPATQPFAADGPIANDVTAAVFLLLRTQDITSEVFVCLSSDARRINTTEKLPSSGRILPMSRKISVTATPIPIPMPRQRKQSTL